MGALGARIVALPRSVKKLLFVCFDLVALLMVLWLGFSLWLNRPFRPDLEQALLMLAAPAIAVPMFIRMGLYRSVLRYLPERAVVTIFTAVTIAAFAWVFFIRLMQTVGLAAVPGPVALLYWALGIVVVACSRFGAKRLLWNSPARAAGDPTLIYGTAASAVQLASVLATTSVRNVVGFVSDDATLAGMEIHGLHIYPASALENLITGFGVREVIATTPLPNGMTRRELAARFASLPIRLRILPPLADMASGKYAASGARTIDMDDLLRRSQIPADPALMRRVVEGRVILVTGAAGSIGAALSRTIARLNPKKLILVDFNEHGLVEIGRELTAQDAGIPLVRRLGSVTDARLMRQILSENQVETIYHCAAFKHVSMLESNCIEGVYNNIIGSWTMADAAYQLGTCNFVLISSDKAVRPTSVLGATKRWSELVVSHFANLAGGADGERKFVSVRFGNVIGSSGSVVPLFHSQIAAGGPVTLTHNDMTRYFMSVREAAELLIQATAVSRSGDVLLLEMGDPVRIRHLAEDMILLSGHTARSPENPEGDIEIVTIGPAEGEKLHEELFYDPSLVAPTAHPKILRDGHVNGSIDIPSRLAYLHELVAARDEARLRKVLFDLAQP